MKRLRDEASSVDSKSSVDNKSRVDNMPLYGHHEIDYRIVGSSIDCFESQK